MWIINLVGYIYIYVYMYIDTYSMIYMINPIMFPLTLLAWQFPPHMKWEPPSTTSHTSHAGSGMQWIHETMLGSVLRDSVGQNLVFFWSEPCLTYACSIYYMLFFSSPHSVSTLRGSYGRRKGRCLIRVLTLGPGILSVNFRIKWLLWNLDMRFDCAGSHKMCVCVLGSFSGAAFFL